MMTTTKLMLRWDSQMLHARRIPPHEEGASWAADDERAAVVRQVAGEQLEDLEGRGEEARETAREGAQRAQESGEGTQESGEGAHETRGEGEKESQVTRVE